MSDNEGRQALQHASRTISTGVLYNDFYHMINSGTLRGAARHYAVNFIPGLSLSVWRCMSVQNHWVEPARGSGGRPVDVRVQFNCARALNTVG
ncbi:hypothetical protein J6590_049907 [Homalodisca vitripennis]|nr:hypothetical protein J6590_049907 [Homalodisca vitripennis]